MTGSDSPGSGWFESRTQTARGTNLVLPANRSLAGLQTTAPVAQVGRSRDQVPLRLVGLPCHPKVQSGRTEDGGEGWAGPRGL
jgi:hypothetical protein